MGSSNNCKIIGMVKTSASLYAISPEIINSLIYLWLRSSIMVRTAVIAAGENIHLMSPTGYKYIVSPGS